MKKNLMRGWGSSAPICVHQHSTVLTGPYQPLSMLTNPPGLPGLCLCSNPPPYLAICLFVLIPAWLCLLICVLIHTHSCLLLLISSHLCSLIPPHPHYLVSVASLLCLYQIDS